MKYRIEQAGKKRLRVVLTPIGLAREFVAGLAVAAPWCFGGMAVVFAPDLIVGFTRASSTIGTFVLMMSSIACVIMLAVGYRRATSLAYVELDKDDDIVRIQERTILGREGPRYEIPLSNVSAVVVDDESFWYGRCVRLRYVGGGDTVLARAWTKKGEMDSIRETVEAMVGV